MGRVRARTRNGARLWRLGAAAALLASGLSIGSPVRGGDETGGPFMSAFSAGEAGCSGNPPLSPGDCDSWETILATGEASTWELDEDAGLTVNGGAMAATATANALEIDNADGTLGSLTLTATMEATLTGGGNGSARLDFTANFPVASESLTVSGNASVEGHGTAIIGGSGDVEVTIGCAEEPAMDVNVQVLGGAHGGEPGRENDASASTPLTATIPAEPQSDGTRFCSVRVRMDASANTNRANPGSEHGSGVARVSLTVLAGAGPAPSATPDLGDCALEGTVLDGDAASDSHARPLGGIRVELLRDSSRLGEPVATNPDGRYCIPWDVVPQSGPATPEPGSYELRATLVDATHEPPVFQTEHADAEEPVSALFDVDTADWGQPQVELAFTGSDERPWLPDVAAIHWESTRFVDWILDVLLVPPGSLTGLRIRAFDAGGTFYTEADKVAHIAVSGSAYFDRDSPLSPGPENKEWHEIGHHLGPILGVAPPFAAAACAGRTAHGGWSNTSTCDSLGEAFAMFVPTIASIELDADRSSDGYGTPHYAGFGSSEDNDYAPWSFTLGADGARIYREDLAVLRLLWDLQDDTPNESKGIALVPRSGSGTLGAILRDRVALGGTNLINLLTSAHSATVADLYDFLTTNGVIDSSLRTPSLDVDADGTADLSPIDEVFLMHDFRPLGTGAYVVGSRIGRTPPGGAVQPDRSDVEPLPGEVVRLSNTGSGVATFSITMTSESGSQAFRVAVAPGATLDLPLSLGPYWTGLLADGAPLPACGAEGERAASISVAGPGGVSESVDACDYAHRVVAATDGAALTVTAAGSEPVPSEAPAPGTPPAPAGPPIVVIVVVVAVLVVAAVGGFLLLRRSKGTSATPGSPG